MMRSGTPEITICAFTAAMKIPGCLMDSLKSMFYAEDGAKAVNWYDEELNKDLGEVLKTQDEEKRTELYDKILTRINDQAVTVPLYYRTVIISITIPD